MSKGTRSTRTRRGLWAKSLPGLLGEVGNHQGTRGRSKGFDWGTAALLGWFAVAIVWAVDRSPIRIFYFFDFLQHRLFSPFFGFFRGLFY